MNRPTRKIWLLLFVAAAHLAAGSTASAQVLSDGARARQYLQRLFPQQARPFVTRGRGDGRTRPGLFTVTDTPPIQTEPAADPAQTVTRWEDLFDNEPEPSLPSRAAPRLLPDTRPTTVSDRNGPVGPAPVTPVAFESQTGAAPSDAETAIDHKRLSVEPRVEPAIAPGTPPERHRSEPIPVQTVQPATEQFDPPAPLEPESPATVVSVTASTVSQLVSPGSKTSPTGTPPAITRADPVQDVPVAAGLESFAASNTELVRQSQWMRKWLESTEKQSVEASELKAMLSRHFERVKKKQKQTGLTTTLGLILHHERERLPDIRKWQRERSRIKDRLRELNEIEFSIERQQADLDKYVASVNAATLRLVQQHPADADRIRQSATAMVSRHRKLLDRALADGQAYSDELTNFDSHSSELINTALAFESHINKNVLWIRSTDPIGTADFAAVPPMLSGVSDPSDWASAAVSLVTAIGENLPIIAVAALLVLLVMTFGGELRRRLVGTADRATVDGQVRLLPTFEALAITVVLAIAWPAFIYSIGWALAGSLNATPLGLACGYALQTMAAWYGSFALPRQLCREGGLAHRHFGWRPEPLGAIYNGLPGIMTWGLPVVAFVAFLSAHEQGHWSGNVGRIAFVAGTLVLARHVRRGLDPARGFVVQCAHADGRLYRTRYAAVVLGTLIPLSLAGTSAAGYHHSALQLSRCLQQTWMLAFAIAVSWGIFMRGLDWIIESFDTGKPGSGFPFRARVLDPTGEEAALATAQLELDRSRAQVYRFLTTLTLVGGILGSWGIWHNVLPALNVVNDVHLWQMSRDVAIVDVDGNAPVQAVRQFVWITLGDVIRAVLIFVVTIVAARNLPGLLDTLLLRRLPFDQGGRHAISTICRYVLTAVGCILTLKAVGVDWASLQWMVAAMTVGLGFGLQEIFANFVSGLIILLERPVRIGDFVTVNGETGFVTRIQFRATTITDLDRRELLVPNKKFITDELINWTLSDPITRLVVPVGIAYGSDTSEAHRLLLDVAQSHPAVLKEPEPSAVMMSFGDSTLNFELRVFIPRRDEFAQILHELNTAIDRKFRKANIEIAFPQCDINVRGLEQFAAAAMKRAG